MKNYNKSIITNLNNCIEKHFKNYVFPIKEEYKQSFTSISRIIMLDRYSIKDKSLKTLEIGDLVLTIVKDDINYPTKGIGIVKEIKNNNKYIIEVFEEFFYISDENKIYDKEKRLIIQNKKNISKPLEIFYEQICLRLSNNILSNSEQDYKQQTYNMLKNKLFIPAGRILHGLGNESKVTYFNCYVMPFINDSRTGISNHRKEIAEIMSRGGGVGTNGSTLRPHNELAKEVGGVSSGSVSWLNDISRLTHLIQQGGTRRGAQMIMLSDWHPDIIEFIISKMQNVNILKWIKNNFDDSVIVDEINKKLKFTPLSLKEIKKYNELLSLYKANINDSKVIKEEINKIKVILKNKGVYTVNEVDFLKGANISITISDDFMFAVKNDLNWTLKFPNVSEYNKEEKEFYNTNWDKIGNVKEWQELWNEKNFKTKALKSYHTLKAKTLWNLICFCARYSAEPGIFFIDRANELTNAHTYNEKVVATNPCGEQPLTPYAVCNLGAINLSQFVNKETKEVLWSKLKEVVRLSVRFLDNIIDKSYIFLDTIKTQIFKERRIGLGVMGLHDFLIYQEVKYGSKKSLEIIDKLFEFIATNAYNMSADLAKEKFPFDIYFKEDKEITQNEIRKRIVSSKYFKKFDKNLKEKILNYGIRNSHLLTVAPTGTTGTLIGVSTGLEPYYAFEYFRSGRLGKYIKINVEILDEFIKKNPEYKNQKLPNYFISAMELTPEEHVQVQCKIQKWVDSSISKTINAPSSYTVEDVQKIYMMLYDNNAKGGTVYVDGSRNEQVLHLTEENDNSKTKEKNDKDICFICKKGKIIISNGCSTCSNCKAQLKCGL